MRFRAAGVVGVVVVCILLAMGAVVKGAVADAPEAKAPDAVGSSELRATAFGVCKTRFGHVVESVSEKLQKWADYGLTRVPVFLDALSSSCEMELKAGSSPVILFDALIQHLCAPARHFYVQCDTRKTRKAPATNTTAEMDLVALDVQIRAADDERLCDCKFRDPATAPAQ